MAAIDTGRGDGPLLTTSGLTKSFRSLVALKNHEISIRTGEIVGVIGPNGSGKSTFFNVVSGFLRPDKGAILFDGRPIEHLSASEIVRLGIARTFQGTRLFQRLSVAENLRAAAQLRHHSSMFDAVLGSPHLRRMEQEVEAIATELLALIGLSDRASDRASDLPYGDQRRLELARALATRAAPAHARRAGRGHGRRRDARAPRRSSTQVRHRYRLAVDRH